MSRLPDLEAWALFARVVETGSFARAAESVGVSQPTVSKSISRLEHRLGTVLLNRTTRGFSLSAAGEAALEKARRLLREGEAAEIEAAEQASTPFGVVRVTAPVSFGSRHLTPLIPAFLERNPGIKVELSFTDQFVDLIAGGYDLAVRIGTLSDSSLRMRRLCAIRRRLVAAPAYLAQHERPIHPRDLAEHECLIHASHATPEIWRFQNTDAEDYSVAVDGRLKADTAEALAPALLAGHGIALLPEFLVCDDLAAGRLEEVLPDWHAEETSLNLVMPPSRLRPVRVTALADYLARHLTPAPWASSEPAIRIPQPWQVRASAKDDHRRPATVA